MLKINERISFTGESVVEGNAVCSFSALIDLDNPEKVIINQVQKDKDAYKANRAECRADFAAFEDAVYARHDEILSTVNPPVELPEDETE